ncbi:MAG: hypothetical protein KME23_02145, partial [Goleter apudmare HA4340-LM2]|nr:hypothetical protein [Goleter apudmare HA4340-LM2]
PGSAAALSPVFISSIAAWLAVSLTGFDLLICVFSAPALAVLLISFVCAVLGVAMLINILVYITVTLCFFFASLALIGNNKCV